MESNKNKLKKSLKKYNMKMLILISILAIILLICICVYAKKNKEPIPEAIDLVTATKTNQYATVKVQFLSEPFATKNGQEYSFIVDEDKTIYIVKLSMKDSNRLKQIKEYTYSKNQNEQMPESIQIFGRTAEITSDLKKVAIESYNEMYDSKDLNDNNFSEYLGDVYLDTNLSAVDHSSEEAISILSIAIIVYSLIEYFKNKFITNKTIKEYKKNGTLECIYDQLNQIDTEEVIVNKLFLTKEYLVVAMKKLIIIKYEDINWIYPINIMRYGNIVEKCIEIIKKNKQKIKIFKMGISNKNRQKDMDTFSIIYNEICKRVPDALKGYTEENKNISKKQ